MLRSTRINKGFFGARGLSLERGLMDLNPDEVRLKQQMAAACERVIGIFDGTKWQRSALLSFVPADRVDAIVTDAARRPRLVAAWRERGVEVSSAEPAARARRALRAAPDLLRGRDELGSRLMATMVAVDLGAQSGRVALGRFDGERLSRRRGAPLPERARARRTGRSHWDVLRALRGRARRARARPPRETGGHVDSVGVDTWGVDFGAARPAGPAAREPRPPPRRAHARARRRACSRACRRASSTSGPASS